MTMPNFLIVGAAKSGTTALHTYLQQHPQIYMTPEKETNFFAFEGQTLNFQGPGDAEGINQFSITHRQTYLDQFNGVTQETAIGEACPLYLYHPEAPVRIQSYVPNAKLIIILRDPVGRAYANYLHLVRDGRECYDDFSQALQEEAYRIRGNWEWFWHYIQQGYYAPQLQRYYERFDAQQIRVYLFDDFRANPTGVLQDIFQYLEVDDQFVPDMSLRPNVSGKPKNQWMHQLLTQPNPLKSMLKPLFPAKMRQKIQHQNLAKPKITKEVTAWLMELYREDILACQALLGRDLSAWLKQA